MSPQTIGYAIEELLEEEEVRLRRSTLTDYRLLLRTCIGHVPEPRTAEERQYVRDGIANVSMFRLRRDDVRQWLVRLQRRGVSPTRVRKAFVLLRKTTAELVDSEVLERDPCAGLRRKLPPLPEPHHTVLEPEEIEVLRGEVPARYAALIEVLAWGGLRIGEAFALQRDDLVLRRGLIIVARSQSEAGGHLTVEKPKSGKSRYVAPGETSFAVLRRHLDAFVAPAGDARLFTTDRGLPLRYSNFRSRVWLPAVKRAGFPELTPHDLRATCASNLFALGMSVKEVQDYLGHADPQVTLAIYTKVMQSRREMQARKIDMFRAEHGAYPRDPV
jgi:integrase